MKQNMTEFISRIVTSPRRLVMPIMTTPGIELTGSKPSEVFQNGTLQFRCIEALDAEVGADALVTFMDLSVEAEAFGCPIEVSEHENPAVTGSIISDEHDIRKLAIPKIGSKRTAATLECARLCAQKFTDRPVFGGMIGPFSLAGRLADMTEMMILAASEPENAALLLDKVTDFLTEFAQAIKETGVNGLVIAEPAAGLLSPEMCQEFAADYLKKIISRVQDENFMVILHNCGKTDKQIPALLSTGAAALHIGNATKLTDVLPLIPGSVPLMGNIDPVGVLKNETPENIYAITLELLKATAQYRNFVLSSGCDIPPGVPMVNIKAFFRAAEDFNRNR